MNNSDLCAQCPVEGINYLQTNNHRETPPLVTTTFFALDHMSCHAEKLLLSFLLTSFPSLVQQPQQHLVHHLLPSLLGLKTPFQVFLSSSVSFHLLPAADTSLLLNQVGWFSLERCRNPWQEKPWRQLAPSGESIWDLSELASSKWPNGEQ